MADATTAPPGMMNPAAASERIPPRRLLCFLIMVFGMFMSILDIQIVSASLAEIQAGLSASQSEVSWVQTSYLIAEVIAIPLSGFMSRALGTRLFGDFVSVHVQPRGTDATVIAAKFLVLAFGPVLTGRNPRSVIQAGLLLPFAAAGVFSVLVWHIRRRSATPREAGQTIMLAGLLSSSSLISALQNPLKGKRRSSCHHTGIAADWNGMYGNENGTFCHQPSSE